MSMNMPASEYNSIYRQIDDGIFSKEELQRLYDRIVATYDDGREIVRRLDSMHNRKYTGMNLH